MPIDVTNNSFDSVEILNEVMQASLSDGTTRELARGDTVILQPTASGIMLKFVKFRPDKGLLCI